ncbi:MAG: ribonuclease J [Peptococcaceae bacterium]|nr:ribonuclease J [Peptococcaceae bacterium]
MRDNLQFIPLGGMGEIGKNMYAYQYGDDILVVDSGLKFPEEEMFGIDYVIPNISYLLENQKKVQAIFLTHGHEDHVGALPFVLKQLPVPVYGTKLTLGLLKVKLDEHNVSANLKEVRAGDVVPIGRFKVQCIHMNHSIPDSLGLAIKTPVGTIFHSGDFKLDQTPVDGRVTDYFALTTLGQEGVLALMADSTNAHRPGYTKSERDVGKVLDDIFAKIKGRAIVATFASNIHRIQQVFDTADRFGRKVAVVGRSMVNNVTTAVDLGYLVFPKGILVEIEDLSKLPADKVVIISTGSQGEPLSGLTRMASGSHPRINILPGDTVILASTPVPGNEKLVSRVIDGLAKAGAQVIYQGILDVHVSGHASREELKLLINMLRPKFMVPIHGEYRHQAAFSNLAQLMGYESSTVLAVENGDIVEFTRDSARPAGKVTAGSVLVDGIGVGDVGNVVLRDRQQLAADGVLVASVTIDRQQRKILAGPTIISRGFVYVKESESLLSEAEARIAASLLKALQSSTEWSTLRNSVREPLVELMYEKTRRRPVILPMLMELNRD